MTEPKRRPDLAGPRRHAPEYEYLVLTVPRGVSKNRARQLITEHAEYGHWELERTQLFWGGLRRFWLRRRIIRVTRTG